jgi:hypothetical protein
MRKHDFLDKLKAAACASADEALTSVGRTAKGCPYLERWIGHLRTKDSHFVERGIRKYAPESAGVTNAEGYIPFVAARVSKGVTHWARTGEITEVPDELKGQLLVANTADAMDRLFSGVGGVMGAVGSAVVGGVRAVGGLFAKAREGGIRDARNPLAIQEELGKGHPLDGGVKSRMESAFGGDFSGVRIHNDSTAASLSTQLNARAFTVGRDVAFGAGEYQPGTLIGDALIAHELAHVVQQEGGATSLGRSSAGSAEYDAFEEDADLSALGVMVSMYRRAKGALGETSKNAIPSLRSGLTLQRCGHTPQTSVVQPAAQAQTAQGAGTPASGDPCSGPVWAATYRPTTEGTTPTLGSDEFGKTSKLGAYPKFGACRLNGVWQFHLTGLRVPINSAVQPPSFRINVDSAQDPAVTQTTFRQIVEDLRPDGVGTFHPKCGNDVFDDRVRSYSWRRRFWKHQLSVDHEAFHRQDWDQFYRRELVTAEQAVWGVSIPENQATSETAAVQNARSTLDQFFVDAYGRACRAYSPQQESRAYDNGKPAYEALANEVQARATHERWDQQQQQQQQGQGRSATPEPKQQP